MSDELENKRTPFVVGSKAMIMDEHLPPEAKVLYMYLDSNTESFKIIWDVLVKILGNDNKVRRAVAALKERGMLKIVSKKDPETKQFCGRKWTIYDYQSRTEEKPHAEKAARGNIRTRKKPHAEISTDYKTNNSLKTKKYLKQTNQQAPEQTADPEQADPVLAELKDFDDQNIHPVIAKVFQACGITGPDAVSKHLMWAEGLLRQYGFEAVEQQAEWLPYRKNVKIPKQYLTSALKEGYEAPPLPPDVELAMQKREMIAQIWANIDGIDDLPVLENGSEYSMCNQRLNAIMRPAFDRAIEAGRVNEGEAFWHRRREAEGVLMGEYFSYNGDMQPVCAYELVFMDWPGRQQDLEAVINAI